MSNRIEIDSGDVELSDTTHVNGWPISVLNDFYAIARCNPGFPLPILEKELFDLGITDYKLHSCGHALMVGHDILFTNKEDYQIFAIAKNRHFYMMTIIIIKDENNKAIRLKSIHT